MKAGYSTMNRKLYLFLPNLGMGGAEKVAARLSIALESYEKTFVLLDKTVAYPHAGALKILHIESSLRRSWFGKLFKLLRLYRAVRGIKKEVGGGISLSFMPLLNIINILTRRQEKVVISVRNFESRNLSSDTRAAAWVYRVLIRMLYKKADSVVVVSRSAAHDLVTNFGVPAQKVKTIYNPVDLDRIAADAAEVPEAYGELFRSRTLTHVGSFKRAKGHRHLIRIFARLKQSHPDLRLLLIGDGPLLSEMANLSESLGLRVHRHTDRAEAAPSIADSDIYFLGERTNPYQIVARSTLFLHPSLWEGFPNVLLEAMACGVPIIAADCPSGPRELLAPETDFLRPAHRTEYTDNGILLPPFETESPSFDASLSDAETRWVSAVGDLLEHPERGAAMAEHASERVKAFQTDRIMREWDEEFSSLYRKRDNRTVTKER